MTSADQTRRSGTEHAGAPTPAATTAAPIHISGNAISGPLAVGDHAHATQWNVTTADLASGPDLNRQVVSQPALVSGHAFISYAREDSARVEELTRALEAAGIPVWRDTADLWPGQDWRENIRRAITDNALVFIACFSRASLARGKRYQNEELVLAIEQLRLRRPDDPWLIPVRFDECDIPDRDIGGGRTLASIQRVDLFGGRSAEGAARLVGAVSRILRRGSSSAV